MIFHNDYANDPNVYYAEATSYIDAIDYADFMRDQGWELLVEPFVTRVERVPIQQYGDTAAHYLETPVEWGFVLHRFNTTTPRSIK